MIEAQQFILWLVRKIFAGVIATPKRWHDRLTDIFEYDDWIIPVILIIIGAGISGLGLGIFFAATGHSDLGSYVLLSVWGTSILFVVSAGIRYMYRVFKQEQKELIDTLKQHNG